MFGRFSAPYHLSPHLHTHALVANLACDEAGRWSGLDGRMLYQLSATAGSLYRAQLRHDLSASLGVSWSMRRGGFGDICGIPRNVVREFSQRSREIEDETARLGHHSRTTTELAAIRTRPAKDHEVSVEHLTDQWWERAYRCGLSQSRLANLGTVRLDARREKQGALFESVDRATREFDRPFSRTELLRATCDALPGGGRVTELEEAVDRALGGTDCTRVASSRLGSLKSSSGAYFPTGRPEVRYLPSGDRIEHRDRHFLTPSHLVGTGRELDLSR